MHRHTNNPQRRFTNGLQLAAIAFAAALLALSPSPAKAAPFTHDFDPLIADLQDRATSISNSTDKVEQKQFKTIEKILGTFDKDSTSLATDIKTLGSVGKTLVKSFPTDFTPPGTSLLTNLLAAVAAITNDVQAAINTAGTNIDALADSACKTKAQATLGAAQESLDQAVTAPSEATAIKLLGSALKTGQKADAAATKCAATTSGGGGGGGGSAASGDFVKATIMGNFSASFVNTIPVNCTLTPFETTHTNLSINCGDSALDGIGMEVVIEDPTDLGPYPVFFSTSVTRTTPSGAWSDLAGAGTIHFTTLDIPGQKLIGTFDFVCTNVIGTSSSVTVTNGSFSISKITPIGF